MAEENKFRKAPVVDLKIDSNEYEKDQVGFPPYWKPVDTGDWFRGKVLMLDDRDPDFPRYVIEATQEFYAYKGTALDAEPILVLPGELYTINSYSSLPLERYYGNWDIVGRTVRKRKLAASTKEDAQDYQKRPRDLWDWEVMIPKELKQLLKSQREEESKMLAAAREQARKAAVEKMASQDPTKLFQ